MGLIKIAKGWYMLINASRKFVNLLLPTNSWFDLGIFLNQTLLVPFLDFPDPSKFSLYFYGKFQHLLMVSTSSVYFALRSIGELIHRQKFQDLKNHRRKLENNPHVLSDEGKCYYPVFSPLRAACLNQFYTMF
jgi:hypothetical protein